MGENDDTITLLSVSATNIDALQDLIELVDKARQLGMPLNAAVKVTGHSDSVSITWGLYNLENQ